jgi:hypothetical protein
MTKRKKEQEILKLTRELMELLEEGNIAIQQVCEDPYLLMEHPDFERAIDILAALEDLYEDLD